MKVVFLARYLPQEGSTTHMYTLAKGLIDRGHEIHVVSAGPKQDESAIKIYREMIDYGIKHHKVGFPLKRSLNLLGKVKQVLKYGIATPKVLYLLLKLNPDIIHVHYPVTSYIAKIYGRLTGKKFVTTHHISGIPRHPLHRKADYVIAISKELESELNKIFNYNKEQVKLIFNGVSTERFNKYISRERKLQTKEELGLPKNKVIIGFVGSFIYRKGIDVLLEAVSKLKEDNCHLVLVGDGDVDWVKTLIQRFKVEKKVSLYPFQDPIKFYETFDVFILPSRQEGFPLVSLEAMMMGIPVIRSNVEGSTDQIDHGTNGYIFENENSEELSNYMSLLLNNKKSRELMGEKARQKIIKKFSEENMMEKLLIVYEEAINKAKKV